ncbi:MAG: undecaprenyl-phosphate galactose phosphotransferase WbaP [Selenomonadaceae bacterium]|nr:undecaprenyl-phosphate galactose phosphotransferase WbaP [Selenomonadaceae bacterium]
MPCVKSIKLHRYVRRILSVLADYIAILLAEKSAMWVTALLVDAGRYERLASSYTYFWIPVIFILFYSRSNIYHMRPILDKIRDIFYCTCNGLVVSLLFLYFAHKNIVDSVVFPVAFAIFAFVLGYVIRYVYWRCQKSWHLLYEPVILIGAGKTAEKALRFYEQDLGYRYDVLGLLEDFPQKSPVAGKYPVLGGMWDAGRIVQETGVKTVVITAPGLAKEQLQKLISQVQPHVRNISFVPDLLGTQVMGVEANVFFTEAMLMLKIKNQLARRRNRVIKRAFDLLFTICGGLCILPFLLVIAVMVAVDNKGNVIFAHRRIGRDGKEFKCYKFQTMIPNAQEALEKYLAENPEARKEWEESFKLTDDPRVTKLGSILRKTSLDEMPQLWNVIKGDMSLVGPRPIVAKEIERYGEYFREYAMVPPGITGMWQASGRSDTTYEERVEMDTWYVRNWSVWIDLMYLFKTVKIVFTGKGAY